VAFDGSGHLWIANYRSGALLGYEIGQLRHATGRAHLAPAITASIPGGPNQIAVDGQGRLWLADWDTNTVSAYQATSLGSGSATPAVVLSGPDLASPTDLAFDSAGNLWVANQASGRVLEFRATDLDRSGSPRPAASLLPGGAGRGTPEAIAFDPAGRLWVSDYYRGMVMALARSELRGRGRVRPELNIDVGTRTFPIGLTFDRSGRLWMAGAHAIVVFRVHPRRATDVAMRLSGPDVVMPHDVSFDATGAAWVPCYNDTVLRYSAAGLHGTRVRPDLVLT
jgi:sugar lactone lactonase YvrE